MNISSKILKGRWTFGGSVAYLVFSAKQDFRAVDGEIIKDGPYRSVQCVVTDRDVTIPLIASIPTTTDSSDPSATWDTWFEDSQHTKRFDWLTGFQLSHVFASPVVWQAIFDDNNPQGIPVPSGGISYEQAVLLNNNLRNEIAGNTLATGTGTLLVGGDPVTILDSHVAADSPIDAIAKVNGITGKLRILNRVAGVSFDVVSDNGADSGNFKWIIWP